MQQSKKAVPRKSRSGSSSIALDLQLNKLECEGWLYVKEVVVLKHKYFQRWCVFHSDHMLHIFTDKAGKLKEEINISVCRITPITKARSTSFYFNIINEWSTTTFGTKNEKDYTVWINNLQLYSSLNKSSDELDCSKQLVKHFDSVQRSLSIDSVDQPPNSEEDGVKQITDVKETDSPITYRSISGVSVEAVLNENASTSPDKINRSDDLPRTDNNEIFAKINDLERQIRDKSYLLSKINNFLRSFHFPEELDLFWEEHREQMINY